MSKQYTAEQINKKYKGKYIEVVKSFDYSTKKWMYEVVKTYKQIHENTTLGEDVGTSLEYTR
jgi:hypothetical protein